MDRTVPRGERTAAANRFADRVQCASRSGDAINSRIRVAGILFLVGNASAPGLRFPRSFLRAGETRARGEPTSGTRRAVGTTCKRGNIRCIPRVMSNYLLFTVWILTLSSRKTIPRAKIPISPSKTLSVCSRPSQYFSIAIRTLAEAWASPCNVSTSFVNNGRIFDRTDTVNRA